MKHKQTQRTKNVTSVDKESDLRERERESEKKRKTYKNYYRDKKKEISSNAWREWDIKVL